VTQGQYSTNVGSRTYLMDTDDSYMLFKLKNKEFTYTVDDSQLGCGLNGAAYFVQMDVDGGKAKYGNAGAAYGTGYCDAQCPHDIKFINGLANSEGWTPSESDPSSGAGKYGSCCVEIDIWEANSYSSAFTMHSCDADGQTRCEGVDCGDNDSGDRFKGLCDKNGCDMQSYRLGEHDFFGPGSSFKIDSTKPIQVTTQFITDDNTDSGKLVQVKQLYHQNGLTVEHPIYSLSGNAHDSITDSYCSDWVAETQDGTNFIEKGGLSNIDAALEAGVVLVMSLWDDHDSNMLWLDSTYPVGSTAPGAARGTCASTSGAPKDVESEQANAKVVFSDIRVGPIGSTTNGPVPSPTPSPSPSPSPSPTPAPTPASGGTCCWGGCSGDCHADAFCDASADQCTGNCAGVWCSSMLV
jgi:cellulose 1,4-beta-cellobiosidase